MSRVRSPVVPGAVACWIAVAVLVSLQAAAGATAQVHAGPQRHLTALPLPVTHSSSVSSSCSSGRRSLQQAQSVGTSNRDLPRPVIGRVKSVVGNTYSWSIQRQSSASGIALTADGYSRKQLGYSLAYTRTLTKTEYRLEGVVTITGTGTGSATLLSVNILAAGRDIQANCQGMPAARYELLAGAVIECPFVVTWVNDPGNDVVSGYVQTSFGRATATGGPVPYSFSNCAGGGDGGSAASCSMVETAACVSVTDGSYITNKYKDKLGTQLAGKVTRSRLFETSNIQDSTLGPPRIEPVTPTAAVATASTPRPPDGPPVWTPKMPDQSWWNGRHRLLLGSTAAGVSKWNRTPARLSRTTTTSSSSSSGSSSRRALTQSRKDELTAELDANFAWPYPTITGDRPPVGLNGKPERGSIRQICGSRTFSFGMVWGPLLPAACGTFEVQNFAAAVPTDGSGSPISYNSYTYLQVVCPTAVQERANKVDQQQAAGKKASAAKDKGG